jgi:hypothetical protein
MNRNNDLMTMLMIMMGYNSDLTNLEKIMMGYNSDLTTFGKLSNLIHAIKTILTINGVNLHTPTHI